jgi:hypothetical protein
MYTDKMGMPIISLFDGPRNQYLAVKRSFIALKVFFGAGVNRIFEPQECLLPPYFCYIAASLNVIFGQNNKNAGTQARP